MFNCPWFKMWTSPRSTIRQIVSTNPKKGMMFLSIIFGIQYLLGFFYSLPEAGLFVETKYVLASLVFSPIVGYAWFYLQGAILYWIGKIFKGKAKYIEMVSSSAWSLVPAMAALVFWLCLFLWLYISIPTPNRFVNALLNIVPFSVNIWSAVLLINCLKELQEYSYGKAIGNFLLSAFVFGLCLLGVIYGVSYLVTMLFFII